MLERIIDAHIHLDIYKPDEQSLILGEMEASGVDALISVSNHLLSAQKNLQLARYDSRIKPAIGFHPEQPLPSDEEVADLLALIDNHQDEMTAVGEVGLPYYSRQEGKADKREAYMAILRMFIQKAVELDKPVVLHAIYDDAPVVCDLLEKHSSIKAHFHWFKGDARTVERMARNGYFVSVTPDIVYKEKTRKLVRQYPLEKMMVETDGPWSFEGIFDGKMTHPDMIRRSIYEMAMIKRIPLQLVYDRLYENTSWFYGV
ncbi:TatD family hydrolase [Lentibacillus sp. CBA3610]|uniref:TatD family hydrolase n=1 Tax=Lentibacillus sp. CBA3610 TaxID=2518176 RepID=UPI0015957CB9|nr:TatD family hydrolase [Lentibacillus sp. CBA3610]QKY70137.1 TatD family deoxyribonuclease [Lentibacillus sp. CBA3610]